jgi:hypothetical protein
METQPPGTSQTEAYHHAVTINAYWAERGIKASATVVQVYDYWGRFVSYGIESKLSLTVPSLVRRRTPTSHAEALHYNNPRGLVAPR